MNTNLDLDQYKNMDKNKIKNMFFNANGRINRQPYIQRMIILLVLNIVVGIIVGILSAIIGSAAGIFYLLVIPLVVSMFFLTIQRLHDWDKTGWLALILLVLGWIWVIVLCIVEGTKGANQYGPDPLGR